jgi:molybdopterin-guanine dinucleotide biosynthesis protein
MAQAEQKRPFIVGVGGFASNTGKTTLVCDLLRFLPGWEAIKLTRGHYRSCGKETAACCVSDLLRSEPVIRAGRAETYATGKDTGRFWDAGAVNVQWLIATSEQVKSGINLALSRVNAAGVIIEGTSFWQFARPDVALLAANPTGGAIKQTARRVRDLADGIYLGDADEDKINSFRVWLEGHNSVTFTKPPAYYSRKDLPELVAKIQTAQRSLGKYAV